MLTRDIDIAILSARPSVPLLNITGAHNGAFNKYGWAELI